MLIDPIHCRHVYGGNLPISTTTEVITSNPGIVCECTCKNVAEQAFIDESDDIWIWWLISKPYNLIAKLF